MATSQGDDDATNAGGLISAVSASLFSQPWANVATEWGIDFEPAPPVVVDTVIELIGVVE